MKIAVSSYSYLGALRDGRMTMLDVIPKAKKMGFDGVEIVNLGDSDAIRQIADKLYAQSREYGVSIVSYMTSGNFLADDLGAEVSKMQREVELCVKLGATKMRHDACWAVPEGTTFESVLPRLVDGYRRVTEYAVGLGVHTMLENHGQFIQDSSRVEAVVKGVNHKNFGWLVDIGNFLCVDEDPASAVPVGMKYASHVHAKDFHMKPGSQCAPQLGWFGTRGGNHLRGAMFGHGNMNLGPIFKTIRESGYDDWIALEFEGVEDCLVAIPEGLKNLKYYLEG